VHLFRAVRKLRKLLDRPRVAAPVDKNASTLDPETSPL
jgi:hypothetical protein